MEEDVRCPACGTTKYANSNMRMMVNVCGHSLCESCVELLFIKGAAKCPTCNVILKRTQFRIRLYDDEAVEKDLEVRRKLLKEIYLREEDFDTLSEYNIYLEMFETFVANLTNGIDVAETRQKIEEFKLDYANKLQTGRTRISKDMEIIEQMIEEEQEAERNRYMVGEDDETTRAAEAAALARENLVDNLLNSNLPAELILRSHQQRLADEQALAQEIEKDRQRDELAKLATRREKSNRNLTFSSGIRVGNRTGFDDIDMKAAVYSDAAPYRYVPLVLPWIGPVPPTPKSLVAKNYIKHVIAPDTRALAGGFLPVYPCQRAIQEALMDLTFE